MGHDGAMNDYSSFARFYDTLMDDPQPKSARVLAAIEKFLPDASSLLELGCGTGSILAGLRTIPSLVGLDRSPEMLKFARAKVPSARLIETDIASFDLDERFDVAICVFDTLNHLPSFNLWTDLFGRVYDHLVRGGLFVFDVNPIGQLRRLGDDPPWIYDFDGNTVIMDVQFEEDAPSIWDVRVFECLGDSIFSLHHESIKELGVELAKIKSSLAEHFDILEESDPSGEVPNDDSIRAFFVFRRR